MVRRHVRLDEDVSPGVSRGRLISDIDRRLGARLDHLSEVFEGVGDLSDQVFNRAADLADGLLSDDPAEVKAATGLVIDLWNRHDPHDVASPLGISLALSGHTEGQAISRADAGRVLGVSRGQIYNLVQDKVLQPTGQDVTLESVARRLLSRRSHRPPSAQ